MAAEPRIVVIDDDRNWAETLADYLRGKGFTVATAHEAREGLTLLEQGSAALALVDVNMPDMDGLEFLRRLRRRNRELAVLMVSGDDEPTLPSRALAEGARAFVPKTTPPNLLLRAVRQALAAGAFGPQAGGTPPRKRHLPALRSVGRTLPVPRPPQTP